MNTQQEKENIAKMFHTLYERYAPDFGYTTRKDTKEFDPETPLQEVIL